MDVAQLREFVAPKQPSPIPKLEPVEDRKPAKPLPRAPDLVDRDQATLERALVASSTSDAPTDTLLASLAFRGVPPEIASVALSRLQAASNGEDAAEDDRSLRSFLQLCARGDGAYMNHVLAEIAEHNARTVDYMVRAHELGSSS